MQDYYKTIGLLGGMAWPSTVDYYIQLNKETERLLGIKHSVKCIIYSFDFNDVNATYQPAEQIEQHLHKAIVALLAASANIILICSNTTHKFLDSISHQYPAGLFLDIRDCIGRHLQHNGIKRCLLLGTKFTMSEPFYTNYISSKYNTEIIAPLNDDQDTIHFFIFQELVNGIVSDKAVSFFSSLINKYDIPSVLLACTELRLAFNKFITSKTIIDTTMVHANAAIQYVLTK